MYRGDSNLWVMDADGSNQRLLLEHTGSGSWSPGGEKIVYVQYFTWETAIAIANADGSDPQYLTYAEYELRDPVWSPDGKKVVYKCQPAGWGWYWIFIMDADGKNSHPLIRGSMEGGGPSWSPDGSKIVYHKDMGKDLLNLDETSLWIINADGTGDRQLTFE